MCDDRVVAIVSGSPTEWLNALPQWQREDVALLQRLGAPESEILETLLTVSSADTTAPFGGLGPGFYRKKFIAEVYSFLCSEDKYQAERESWVKNAGVGKSSSVALLSEAISAQLGAAPPFLAPAVAVTLMTAGTLGLRAWCAGQAELRGPDKRS